MNKLNDSIDTTNTMNVIDPKNSKFPSTLTLALILALTLTWLVSLRPIRLKICDYYYNQGKFEQAVNWYELNKHH